MDEARATAHQGVRYLEKCVRERNENEALRNEKKSRLEATRTMLAEEWNAIVEHDLELLEEDVASLRRTVELQDQRIADFYIRAARLF